MNTVSDRDNGWRAMLTRARQLAKGASVKVGVLADAPKKEPDGASGKLTLVEVAAIHEFGAPGAGIPARSFIRGTVDEQAAAIGTLQHALATRVFKGSITAAVALAQLGAKVAGLMQQRVARGIEPALKPQTIARKGSSKPLVNTNQLRSAFTFEVRD